MKLPINVAKQYATIDLEIKEVIQQLASKIGEVESSTDLSNAYNGVYIAEIKEKILHPDSQKLGIYKISLGKEQHQVVAGDRTLEVGDRVAYIKPGNIVPSTYQTSEEFKIKSIKMGGELSDGMLCSQRELNIGPNHTNVHKLPADAPVGELFSEYYQLDDTVIEIENKALTNRGDLFGIIGLARELSAIQNIQFESPDWYKRDKIDIDITSDSPVNLKVQNDVGNLCPRYMAIVMDNINIEESPVWLKSVLLRTGIKPINNIVDITNYLMVLTGQPLHAFDYDKLTKNDPNKGNGAHITVRLASEKEKLHTLDNKVTQLNSNTVVIADSTNPIAIGGIIGGIDTQIDENTKRIIIESANFDRFNIRKTSMSLGIRTDAVTRFTRAQDPNQCQPVLGKAIELIQNITDGNVASNLEDIYPEEYTQTEITLSLSKANTHLGTQLSRDEVITLLQNLEYQILPQEEISDYLTVIAPTFRRDIIIPEDIHEDIGRIFGYDNIAPTLPLRDLKAPSINKTLEIKSKIRNILKNSGSNELVCYSFVGSDLIKKANQDPNIAFKIKNSLSPELELMRPSLIVSMLEKTQQNVSRNIEEFSLYEFNIPHQKGYMDKFNLPKEDWHLSFVYTSKNPQFEGSPYYQVKRYFQKIVNSLGIDLFEYELVADTLDEDLPIWVKNIIPTFERNSSALIIKKDSKKREIIGVIGEVNTEIKSNFKLPQYTGMFEINLDLLRKSKQKVKRYEESSKYPPLIQDITFTVKDSINFKTIEEIVKKTIEDKNSTVVTECLDIYKENKDSQEKKITIKVTVENMNKTILDKDLQKSVKSIEKTLGNL
jgi:phenylalanyl-tRNA synthetase beta chain